MRLSGDVIKTTASVAALLVIFYGIIKYVDILDGRVGRLEEQVHVIATSVTTTEAEITDFSKNPALSANPTLLKERVGQLEEQVHSLTAAMAAAKTRFAVFPGKPATTVNPLLQKCIELAEQANDGSSQTGMVIENGKDVAQRAVTLMDKLGCASMPR